LFSEAIAQLRRQCEQSGKEIQFLVFEAYDVDRDPSDKLSYQDLAKAFRIPVTAVTNYLASARREFRKIVLQKLREITGNDGEYRSEARRLLGIKLE
jgi:hypothetical protein